MTKIDYILYHENNLERPYFPFEDSYAQQGNVFVVADGIALDNIDGRYPDPSDAKEVSRLVCNTIVEELNDSEKMMDNLKEAIKKANKIVRDFNEDRELYKNREDNGYCFGAAVFAALIVKEDSVLYAVLDDCYFSIFSKDLVDRPLLRSFVDRSAKYYDKNYNWENKKDRKVWRKEIRNKKQDIDGEEIGYGAIDGNEDFFEFVQFGEEKLMQNDLICLYTDGFIKLLKDNSFVRHIYESDLNPDILKYISDYTKENKIYKEKTCYFIRYFNSEQTPYPTNSKDLRNRHHNQVPKFPPRPSPER